MNTIKLRFFNYQNSVKLNRGKRLSSELIRLRSPTYTHVEFQFSKEYNHLSFSSTIEDAFKGCRFKLIRYTHDWWDTIERSVSADEEKTFWERANMINGKKYDLLGLLSFATKWRIVVPNRDRYWCSEAVAFVIGIDNTEITPDNLYLLETNHEKNYN